MINDYLLGAIILIFILQLMFPPLTSMFDFDPSLALVQPYRFVTAIFLHGGLNHILFNALALWMFGSVLEKRIGSHEYLKVFLIGGIVASIGYYLAVLLGITPPTPALGASGAIYAVMGALAVLVPNLRVFFYFMVLRIREAVVLWIIIEFLGMYDPTSMVGHAAHLFGLLFGLFFGKIYSKKEFDLYYEPPPEYYPPNY